MSLIDDSVPDLDVLPKSIFTKTIDWSVTLAQLPCLGPLSPVRTFINLHRYNGALRSLRQYDYYGVIGYESCKGEVNGKSVRLSLDSSDINAAIKATPEYQACFEGMDTN